ncbi:PaaI family thioesterase [Candidatus Actinomarina sp.]|nr:PaaI family thioesterase [Candidatus Actinomarina sp.]
MNDIQFGEGTFDELYGHKIIELKENFIRTEIEITSNLHQPMGLVHGGLYSSMAEAAISYAAYFTQDGTWVGVNNNTDFLKSSKEGLLVCTASPLKLGKRSQLWEAKIYNGDNLCAISKVRLSNLHA